VPETSPFPIRTAEDDEGYDQTLKGEKQRFRVGRNGDHLMCPFQCDLCHFRNLQKRDPEFGNRKDILLLQCIRRASLDACWAREPSTVRANARGARRLEEIGDTVGLRSVCPPMGPYSEEDTFGMGLAVCILLRTLDPGRTEEHIQFSTARYLRSVYSNIYHASSRHQVGLSVMAQNTTRIWVTTCPSYGYWFERFMRGVHKRMGEEVRSDFALSIVVLHKILGHLDKEWLEGRTSDSRKEIAEIAMFLISGFCLGLRGEEVVKMDISGFLTYFEAGRDHPVHPHVMVPLLGRFKGETGERWHLLPIVWRTRSGIEAGTWATRMKGSLEERRRLHGFVYSDKKGKQTKASTLEPRFYEQLHWVRIRYPDLFPPNVNIEDDFGIPRSCRRGSSTEAANQGVPSHIIEMICRWRKIERAQGRAPNLSMREHYMEVSQALETYLQYSRPL
jgi:hypothetical protein